MYSVYADIKKALPEAELALLTDDDDGVSVSTAIVAEAIAAADGEIDGHIGGRYAVPLSPVPDIIRNVSCAIAIYLLYQRKVNEIPPSRIDGYNRARSILNKIADGKISLRLADSSDFGFGAVTSSHFDESPGQLGGLEALE